MTERRLKIVCDDKIPFLKGVFEPYAELVYKAGALINPEDLVDASALIIRTRTICSEELLQGSSVKVIASATIGYDHIDTAYCATHGIKWTNAPGCNSSSVAQYIGSTLIYLSEKHDFSLKDKILGIVGVGNVGSKVHKLAQKLGMRCVLNDPLKGIGVSLKELIDVSDIITLHTPLTPETRHLINPKELRGKILINSSRGPVVDNFVLKEALKEGILKGAVLDVWENEPDIDLELLGLLDIATPHIAGYSYEGKANGTKAAVRAVSEVLGLPLIDWEPSLPPLPEELKNKAEAPFKALRLSYKVEDDDKRLRQNPLLFEKLRGDYPIRREPQFSTIYNSL